MADKKNPLAILSDCTYRERIAERSSNLTKMTIWLDLVYIFYFKDRAVFSLNATGAFSDGIIRAVS